MPKGNPGVKRGPRPGSSNARLAAMRPGDVHWIETTPKRYATDMNVANVTQSRRTGVPEGAEYRTRLYTAIGPVAGEVRYLIRLERVK